MSKKQKTKKAFTLIELVIVMAVIVIVFGLSINSLTKSQDFQIFNNNFIKLQSLVNNARSQAITGKGQLDFTDYDNDKCNNGGAMSGGSCTAPDFVTPGNYGVRFDTASGSANVRLFADINPPVSGSISGQKGRFDNGGNYVQGDDLVLDTLTLPSTIKLEVDDGAAQTSGSIFYSPNYADISFENLSANPFLKIRLRESGGIAQCKQIKIHKLAGIPEVEACS
ncbi:prepilin-type N-terminal cleavage/methylation domain-containing protein [Candidatus Peregrinibacteria bacterium]|nr:prepilin-type N-terminal cleavage/methylation domain-containing protein [Candidatus Peregrinibacteria bacterium]